MGGTVITEDAVNEPSVVVAVIVAEPTVTPVTNPLVLTVATAGFPLVNVTALLAAFAGLTVAVSCNRDPIFTGAVLGFTVTPVTRTGVTVTATEADLPPLTVVTVIVSVPGAIPLITPEVLTVAIALLLLWYVTALFVAFAGAIV